MEPTAEASRRPTVLVVDDERGPRESLRLILEPAHRVLQCGSGRDALELLQTQRVDLVTLDLEMPGMRGEELLDRLRRTHPDVEVIVISGCGGVASVAESLRQGICAYLPKPFEVDRVRAAVARAVARRAARTRPGPQFATALLAWREAEQADRHPLPPGSAAAAAGPRENRGGRA